MWFLLYNLLHLLRSLCSSHKFVALQFFLFLFPFYLLTMWIYEFLKNYPRRGVFCNINLKYSNLENHLERHLRTDRTGECILEHLEAQIWKIFSLSDNHGGAFVGLMYVPICPKKLWMRHCIRFIWFKDCLHFYMCFIRPW